MTEIQSPQPAPEQYLIAHIGHTTKSYEHVVWWNPESKGYTICTDKAGRYSADQAARICSTGECIAVPVADAKEQARTTPYFRRYDGKLAKLYDGGPHAPVENSKVAWAHLMQRRLSVELSPRCKVEKPTPIGAKARAIYLDEVPA